MVRFQHQLTISAFILALTFNNLAFAENSNVVWSQLSESQRKVLSPLAAEWDTLRPWQREKMLDIANDYPKMHADKQALVQKRLAGWSRMTPYERENARKKHQQFQSLPPEKKQVLRKKWMEYKELSDGQKQELNRESPDIYTDTDLESEK